MTRHDYLERLAGVSTEAAGVHAIAAAIAATSDVTAVSEAVLRGRGMTAAVEHELLASGLLRVIGAGLLVVDVEPLTTAQIALERRREADRARTRRSRQQPASSGQTSRDSRDTGVSRDDPQIADAPAGPLQSTSLTRARAGAAHTHSSPPLLNIVNSPHTNTAEGENEVVARVRATLATGFEPAEISDRGVATGLLSARHHQVDPVEAALEAATMGASPTWRTRDAGRTMAIAVRKLSKTSAPPSAPLDRPGGGAATTCPGPDLHAARRDELLAAAAPLAGPEFDLWLSRLQVHDVGDQVVVAASPAHASWIGDRFLEVLEQAAGQPVNVVACPCAAAPQARRVA